MHRFGRWRRAVREFRARAHGLTLTWDPSEEFVLKSITSYRWQDWSISQNFDNSPIEIGADAAIQPLITPSPGNSGERARSDRSTTRSAASALSSLCSAAEGEGQPVLQDRRVVFELAVGRHRLRWKAELALIRTEAQEEFLRNRVVAAVVR